MTDVAIVNRNEVNEEIGAQRLTLEEAITEAASAPRLQQILDGERPLDQWAQAYQADLIGVNRVLLNFAEDIELITGRRVAIDGITGEVIKQAFADPMERVRALIQELRSSIYDRFKNVLLHLQPTPLGNPKSIWHFPIGEVKIHTGLARFRFVDLAGHVREAVLVDPALKSPDDFTRRVPLRVKRKLALLKKTHYDYRPKILDGLLVEEKIWEEAANGWKSVTVLKRLGKGFAEGVQAFLEDPALTISLGSESFSQTMSHSTLFAVDYWGEPVPRPAKELAIRFWYSLPCDILKTVLFALLVYVACGPMQATYAESSAWLRNGLTYPLATVGVVGAAFFGVASVLAGIECWRRWLL